jgi:CRISPR-associated protein Cas5/CasD, subtype I-E/ECOLI
MQEFLIFYLYGPMASWGDIAPGEVRPTFDRPSKSAVMGLIAAALGIRRDEEIRQRELATGYCMAIRIDSRGILLRDHHTIQVPSALSNGEIEPFATRRDELAVPKERRNTLLSSRDYRCDAVYTVCLWGSTDAPPYSLAAIQAALDTPAFVLYLGRKSCPPTLPVRAQIVRAKNLAEAFGSVRFPDNPFISCLAGRDAPVIFWEGDEDTGFEQGDATTRRDNPSSRKRWQFLERREQYTSIQTPGGG